MDRTSEAKEKTIKAQEEETTMINDYEKMLEKYMSNLPSTEKTEPYLPDTTKFEKVEGTDLSNGLVIREKATGSEYVWVEVPKTDVVYPTAGRNIIAFTDDEYTKIENDLHTYTSDYRNGTSYSDTFYDASNDEKEVNKSDWFQSADEYNTAKKKMLKSVYENGGFWVGRYEAGIEDEANIRKAASNTAELVPVSKQNAYPYNYVTRTQAKTLAEKVESGSYTSSLMFGVQWDLVLKYIENKYLEKDYNSDIKTKLNSNSTLIGNYKDNLWNITNANAKYSTNYGNSFTAGLYKKESNIDILLTTGADASFSLMNIYDIAGNVWEWTLERTSDDSVPCACRGRGYSDEGSNNPADSRGNLGSSDVYSSVGFRIAIY